jgi:hypothetical protein
MPSRTQPPQPPQPPQRPQPPPIPPPGPVPVDPIDFVARHLDDERVDLIVERRLDRIIHLPDGCGLGQPLRGYCERRLAEALADIDEIDAEVAQLTARRRDATRLARRYRELLAPRKEPIHMRRAPHWHELGRPVGVGEALAGRELREACTAIIVAADDAMTIPEVRAGLLAHGCDAAPRPRSSSPHNKAIADALADGVRAGALRRLARGVYGPAARQRATPGWLEMENTYRGRVRLQLQRQRAATEEQHRAAG